jgi:hypothetical protein
MTASASPLTDSSFERSYEQRIEALNKANWIRTRRAELKRDLKAGRRQLVSVLLSPPEWIDTMKLADLMLATPKLGRVKVNKLLSRCKVSPSKTVGGASDRQRRELVGLVSR